MSSATPGSNATSASELLELSAGEAVALMQAGDMSAEQYVGTLVARAEAKRSLNAFISFDVERVLDAARAADRQRAQGAALGPLHGVPIPVKDSVLTADYPTTAGNNALRGFAPGVDAEIVKRLKAAGGIVMGKTNLHELSAGYTSANESFGPVRNPYNPTLVAGGSSGGTAAALAAGVAPVGIAEDTGGSVRVPAALCGLAGFRPTTGRYPTTEVVPMTAVFDQIGPEARNMSDIVLMDSVLANRSGRVQARALETARLGVLRGLMFEQVESEVAERVEQSVDTLRDAGATVVDVEIPDLQSLLEQVFLPVLLFEMHETLDRFLRQYGFEGGAEAVATQAGTMVRALYDQAVRPGAPAAIPREIYDNAIQRARPALREAAARCIADNGLDALVFPTTPCVASPIQAREIMIGGVPVQVADILGRNTLLAPCAGLPALTLPAGLTRHGLPVGIELEAAPGKDEELLALGLAVEQALATPTRPVLF